MILLRRYITVLGMTAVACLAGAQSVLSLTDHPADTTIVFPESVETDTHKMMQNWYLQTYTALDKEADTRPDVVTSNEDIIKRLQEIPTTIEMPFNSVVRAYIDMYTGKKRSLVESMLGMSLYYMPIFEQALEREGLPIELKYLPVIESALNPDAVSRAGATGLWQLMLPTARGLGLEVSTLVDERRDPVRSSEAATKYLRQLYEIYNDWSLAIAAYNCGPGNVNKAMRRAGEEGKDFWSIYPYLPAETRGYVPCFIAATYVMNYYNKHNISPALARRPIITDSVHVHHRIHFKQIADILRIPVEELKILNPQYRKQEIPGHIRPYPLVLPANQTYSYIMSEKAIAGHDAKLYARRDVVEPSTGFEARPDVVDGKEGEWITTEEVKYHKVKKRETMASIAKKYGLTVSELKQANGNIRKPKRGQRLKIVTTKREFRPYEDSLQPAGNDNLLVKNPESDNTEISTAETDGYAAASSMEMPEEMPVIVPVQDSSEPLNVTAANTQPQTEQTAAAMPAPVPETPDTASAAVTVQTPDTAATPATAIPAASATDSKVADSFRNSRTKQESISQREREKAQTAKAGKDLKAESGKTAGTKKQASADKKTAGDSKAVYHTVKSGESLYIIAQANGTTVQKLRKLNRNIKKNKIKPGDKIRIK